jgi:hypothetical protein
MNKLDGNAATFLSTAGITDQAIVQDINNLVKDLKTSGIWSKCIAIYPFVGGNATAHRYNLADTSQYNLIFNGGWTHSSTGALPNGTNAFANTAINANAKLTQSNAHLSFYSRTSVAASDRCCFGSAVSSNTISMFIRATGDLFVAYNATSAVPQTQSVRVTNTDSKGFYINNKTSAAIGGLVGYKNGLSIGANTSAITVNSYPNANLLISALTATTFFDNKECAFASVGTSFTATNITDYQTIITNFQTARGRNV